MAIVSEPARTDATRVRITARTLRRDRWWLQPALTDVGLLGFVIYSTWAAFQNADYYVAPYISPFYSPCVSNNCPSGAQTFHAAFAVPTALSPALIVLIFPLGFRVSCYYYRKAYYRSFWLSPPACAVSEPHQRYSGETRLPMILLRAHRYFFFFAVVFAAILTYDAVLGFDFNGHLGMRLGSLVLLINAILIWGIHPWLSLLSTHHWRPVASVLPASAALSLLGWRVGAQRQASAMGMGEPHLGGPHRCLHSVGR